MCVCQWNKRWLRGEKIQLFLSGGSSSNRARAYAVRGFTVHGVSVVGKEAGRKGHDEVWSASGVSSLCFALPQMWCGSAHKRCLSAGAEGQREDTYTWGDTEDK
eukprot:TRINITY_DN20297_c0_g2_i1.p2 TRINITY_DN20297_c0_g2~~TRINITY_DN20297_c0_g2_i1.p2  ORF type:complete len:104 (-),score=3.33 TRINITY_DN20297_c0_g2_i1:467-778(-)